MLASLTAFLIKWAELVGVHIINFFVDCVNAAIIAFVAFAKVCADLLPSSSSLPSLPDVPTGSVWDAFIQVFNWLFPVQFVLDVFGFVIGGMLTYAMLAPVLRWAKLLK